MKPLKELLEELGTVLIFASPVIIILIVVVIWVYCLINYGGKPITEVPAWAWWFMNSGK